MTQIDLPSVSRFVLANTRVPAEALVAAPAAPLDHEGCQVVDILVDKGKVACLSPAGSASGMAQSVDMAGRLVLPTFVEIHAHLDKGHVIPRVRPDGTLIGGFRATRQDWNLWTERDIALRMEFALKCAHIHGVSAIRTHLDSATLPQAERAFRIFAELRDVWRGRVALQAVAITPLGSFLEPLGEQLADLAARYDGKLGGVTDALERGANGKYEKLDHALDTLFALARKRGLDVDLHVDQSDDLDFFTLPAIAEAKLRSGFDGIVVCGHCINLSLQPDETIERTLTLAKEAGLAIASMPAGMMYLMDRQPGRTPRWRGVTAAKEILAAGIPFAVGSDNVRDAWYPFGDHDMLDTLKQAVRIYQLDDPIDEALKATTSTPADLMRLPHFGRIGAGLPANLILFSARSLNSIICRDQSDRIVLANGARINDSLPLHEDLFEALAATAATD